MSKSAGAIDVEVAWATPDCQRIVTLQVPRGTTAREAAELSGIAEEFPEIDLDAAVMGIFSRKLDGKLAPTSGDYVLKPRDRIEIYRPLRVTPMEARRLRAARPGFNKETVRSGSKKKAPRA